MLFELNHDSDRDDMESEANRNQNHSRNQLPSCAECSELQKENQCLERKLFATEKELIDLQNDHRELMNDYRMLTQEHDHYKVKQERYVKLLEERCRFLEDCRLKFEKFAVADREFLKGMRNEPRQEQMDEIDGIPLPNGANSSSAAWNTEERDHSPRFDDRNEHSFNGPMITRDEGNDGIVAWNDEATVKTESTTWDANTTDVRQDDLVSTASQSTFIGDLPSHRPIRYQEPELDSISDSSIVSQNSEIERVKRVDKWQGTSRQSRHEAHSKNSASNYDWRDGWAIKREATTWNTTINSSDCEESHASRTSQTVRSTIPVNRRREAGNISQNSRLNNTEGRQRERATNSVSKTNDAGKQETEKARVFHEFTNNPMMPKTSRCANRSPHEERSSCSRNSMPPRYGFTLNRERPDVATLVSNYFASQDDDDDEYLILANIPLRDKTKKEDRSNKSRQVFVDEDGEGESAESRKRDEQSNAQGQSMTCAHQDGQDQETSHGFVNQPEETGEPTDGWGTSWTVTATTATGDWGAGWNTDEPSDAWIQHTTNSPRIEAIKPSTEAKHGQKSYRNDDSYRDELVDGFQKNFEKMPASVTQYQNRHNESYLVSSYHATGHFPFKSSSSQASGSSSFPVVQKSSKKVLKASKKWNHNYQPPGPYDGQW